MYLKEKIRVLPSSPGVYLMKDSLNTVIYVGKSKNLKSRVRSYFVNSKAHSPKIIKLVKNLKDFDYILTDTEFEALLLECRLIKEIKPMYNRLMKTPKGYCYIKIKKAINYPDIEICSEPDSDDFSIFCGPYTSRNTAERAIYGIKEYYKILCTNNSRKANGCLKYSLNLCIGMCTANPSLDYYSTIIQKFINLLQGTDLSILNDLKKEMATASDNFDFETAAKYRDYIKAVDYLTATGKIIEFTEANNNLVIAELLNNKRIKFFLIRSNKLLFSERYDINNKNEISSTFKENIIKHLNNAIKAPANIGKYEIDEVHIIYNYLKSKTSSCKYISIPNQWITDKNDHNIAEAINNLFIQFIK